MNVRESQIEGGYDRVETLYPLCAKTVYVRAIYRFGYIKLSFLPGKILLKIMAAMSVWRSQKRKYIKYWMQGRDIKQNREILTFAARIDKEKR